ncbi:hypothetical protein DPMN_015792 [Dreissena polymorpha]|uniref:Uncharacterized protein n=1 Tax=Dreissena polymorpha TaxID=45954 RepID=A0A9D4NEB4_DREPO|nr:hypothetical protein DPMN_015792 [Dreissena polymorpha]
MAPLAVTGCRLHPRDGFPSALSALGTAAPGSLFKATPSMFLGFLPAEGTPSPSRMSSHRWSCCPAVPVPLQTGPLDRYGQANSRR